MTNITTAGTHGRERASHHPVGGRRRSSGLGHHENARKRAEIVALNAGNSAASPLESTMTMNMNLSLAPIVALLAGILILVMPRLLNYIVAIYLIIIGLLGLFGGGSFHLR
jgi:hypothetical protein